MLCLGIFKNKISIAFCRFSSLLSPTWGVGIIWSVEGMNKTKGCLLFLPWWLAHAGTMEAPEFALRFIPSTALASYSSDLLWLAFLGLQLPGSRPREYVVSITAKAIISYCISIRRDILEEVLFLWRTMPDKWINDFNLYLSIMCGQVNDLLYSFVEIK